MSSMVWPFVVQEFKNIPADWNFGNALTNNTINMI